jgi:hypothetical protein
MSKTTGWHRDSDECDYYKKIGESIYMIYFCGTYWCVRESINSWSFSRGAYRLLSDAKRAAHNHAEAKR